MVFMQEVMCEMRNYANGNPRAGQPMAAKTSSMEVKKVAPDERSHEEEFLTKNAAALHNSVGCRCPAARRV